MSGMNQKETWIRFKAKDLKEDKDLVFKLLADKRIEEIERHEYER